MTDKTKDHNSANNSATNPTPSGFQPEVPQNADASEEQKKTAASGVADQKAATSSTHGRPRDDEDDGHS